MNDTYGYTDDVECNNRRMQVTIGGGGRLQ